MVVTAFYLLSLLALLIGTAAIYMPLSGVFPVSWLYYHYFIRKPVNWSIFIAILLWTFLIYFQKNQFPLWAIAPILISGFAIILTYKMHQERAFPAVDFPDIADDPTRLPLEEKMQMAVIEYESVTKCYPLDYVIHHHIINDSFNSRIIALTYCAMCRSIIPFDVTEIGPLFVGSFHDANMIVADRRTRTFFQQATFQSIIGKLHPHELKMIPFQILSWAEVRETIPHPQVVLVTETDFREFQLPIPGIWKKIIASESTPGLSSKKRDKTFSSRTHVIGIIDDSIKDGVVYLKKEVLEKRIVLNKEYDFFLVGMNNTVNGFRNTVHLSNLNISLEDKELVDLQSETRWDIRGKYISGKLNEHLHPIAVSDEYWFSWQKFHQGSQLIRLS